jgi:hypothetical protein
MKSILDGPFPVVPKGNEFVPDELSFFSRGQRSLNAEASGRLLRVYDEVNGSLEGDR